MKLYFIILLTIVLSVPTLAQKIEKEQRIKANEVPQKALNFVDSLGLEEKVRWYREESQNGISIEAKTKKSKNKQSIEFDAQGQIEDIEIVISPNELQPVIWKTIEEYFSKNYDAYKVQKTQIQYSGSEKVLLDFFIRKQNSPQIRYELIVQVKKDNKYQLVEFLFSEKGDFLEKNTLQLRNTDNLEY